MEEPGKSNWAVSCFPACIQQVVLVPGSGVGPAEAEGLADSPGLRETLRWEVSEPPHCGGRCLSLHAELPL